MKPGGTFRESPGVVPDTLSSRTCGGCGGPLAGDWPSGFCPTCLLFSDLPGTEVAGGSESEREGPMGLRFFACPGFAERYVFLDEQPVSKGGQGQVYRVKDARLRRIVALKRLPSGASDAARWRFFAEAQIAGQLEHPGFLPIFDAGLDPDGRPFYTTTLLPGRTLAQVIREVRSQGRTSDLKLRRAIEVFERISTTMAHAHARGVFHRDLKPSNILIGRFGEVFVIDFGSAGISGDATLSGQDATRASPIETDRSDVVAGDPDSPLSSARAGVPGTPLFSPPEVFGAVPPSPTAAADIYALGVMLYELLTGRMAYARLDGRLPGLEELKQRIRSGPPEPVRCLNRTVPRDLAAICERAMAWNPADRYATMSELAGDLRAFLETRVVQARRPGRLARAQKWALRRSRPLALAALVLAVVGVSLSFAYSFKAQRESARQINHLRDAQLAARQGRWRTSLEHLDQAEQAGYRDQIDLGLQRIDAWTALSEHEPAAAELTRLAPRVDLGPYRGVVLLRLAEHELFGRASWQSGLDHARQALETGLNRADQAFALGLLAPTSPEALAHFQEALRFDAFHHGAHRASLGLEFLLGERGALESHLRVFKVLYPEDPSPVFIEATWLALEGRVEEARDTIAPLRAMVNERLWTLFESGLEILGQGGRLFDLEQRLRPAQPLNVAVSPLVRNAIALFLSPGSATGETNRSAFRIPQLPCVKNGLEQGMRGLMGLAIPLLGNADAATEKIKAACAVHPEGLLPLAAAMFLEPRRPSGRVALRAFLARQSELFQMAADYAECHPPDPRPGEVHGGVDPGRTGLPYRAARPGGTPPGHPESAADSGGTERQPGG